MPNLPATGSLQEKQWFNLHIQRLHKNISIVLAWKLLIYVYYETNHYNIVKERISYAGTIFLKKQSNIKKRF